MGYGVTDGNIEQKEKDIETIFELHNKLLIVIDNLETITDDKIIDFILDAHKNIKILITSRRGLGQVERRYELNQMKPSEAIALFRQIAQEKNLLSLSRLDNETIKTYVCKVACYPLAIKWVLGNVALGKDINSIVNIAVNEQSDIALFCFDEIYRALSEISRQLLCTLSMSDAPVSAGILKYISNLQQEEFEDSIKELVLVSLVIQQQEKDADNKIATKFNLLELTRGFVRKQLDNNSVLKKQIENRIRSVEDTVEEAERAKKQYKYSLHNFGANTEEEKVAALLGATAFQNYQLGKYAEAVDLYRRAVEIAPRLPSIYRNWAVMESNEGHSIESNKLMSKAVDLNPDDAQMWNISGNLKRKEGKIQDALECYLKAIELSPNDPVILNALGQARCRLGSYEEADKLFRRALEGEKDQALTKSYKHEIINLTSLADNLRRWAEALTNDRNHSEARKKLVEAEKICIDALKLDEHDSRTQDLFLKITFQLGLNHRNDKPETAKNCFAKLINKSPVRYREAEYAVRAVQVLITMHLREGCFDEAKKLFDSNMAKLAKRTDPRIYNQIRSDLSEKATSNISKGKIVTVNVEKGFSIISVADSPEETYLGHYTSFIPKIFSLDESFINRRVTFVPDNNRETNRKDAKFIKFSDGMDV